MPQNDDVQRIGVETVVASLDTFVKDMKTYAKSLTDATKDTTEFQKTTEKQKKSGNVFSDTVTSMGSSLKGMIQGFVSGIPVIGSFGSALTGLLMNPVVLATAAIAGLIVGITKLGIRGGEIEGIRTAFANIIAPVLDADESVQDFVDNLRASAGGAISEVDLLTNTNLALAGATGEVRDTFARSLPALLQTAQVQAAATGQSVDYLFTSLVTGIKRGSPLLIDNTGLVLNMTEAYEAFAEQNNTTVDALSDSEKQIALINATVEAGNAAIAAAGGIQTNAATESAKAGALMKDTVDQLALAFEPIATVVMQGVNALLTFVNEIVRYVAPYIQFFGQTLQSVFSGASQVFGLFQHDVNETVEKTTEGFGAMAQGVTSPMQFILNTLGQLGQFLINAAQEYIRFAANIAAAIGNGLMAGANAYVFPAVINIATFIADFLEGFSPPKRGPLSNIDVGAANVMKAWTEGFVGAFQPQAIAGVASDVNGILGDIGKLGINQVEMRLKNLDLAIRPFQEQLKIVKEQFEALQAPAQAALDAIDRQLASAVQALAMGDQQAADSVRALNIQREALEQNLEAQQKQVDAAQLQLAFAQSQQQQERTLLEIQKARLAGTLKEEQAKKEIVKASAKTAAKGGSGAAGGGSGAESTAPAAGGGTALTAEQQAKVDDFVGANLENPFQGFIDFGAEIGTDFLSGLNAGGEFDTFQSNLDILSEQGSRIAESDPVQGIVGAFTGFADELATVASDAVDGFVGFFTDPEQEGSLAAFISRVNTQGVGAVFGDITSGISSWASDTLGPAFQGASDIAASAFTDPADPDSLYSRFQRASANFGEWVGDISTALRSTISAWVTDNIVTPISDILDPYFDIASEEGFFAAFLTLGADIGAAVGDLLAPFMALFAPIQEWVLGQTEDGGLPAIISNIVDTFSGLPRSIFNALANIAAVLWSVMIQPLQGIINTAVDIFNGFISAITDNQLVNWLRTKFPEVFGDIPQGIQLEAPQIPVPNFTPVYPGDATSQKTGGVTQGPGMVRFHEGEMGMLMKGASMATFNSQFVDAMNALSDNILMSSGGFGMPIPSPANISNTTSNDNSITLNANMQNGMRGADVLNQLALARVFNG